MASYNSRNPPCAHVYSYRYSSSNLELPPKLICIVCGSESDNSGLRNLPSGSNPSVSSNSTHGSLSPIQADYLCSQPTNYFCSDKVETLGNLTVKLLSENPPERRPIFCALHPSEVPRLACSVCCRAICDECITDSECPAASDKKHCVLKMNKLIEKLKVTLENVASVFHKNTTSLSELDKEAQNILEGRKAESEAMKAQLDKSRREQIAEINQRTETLKSQVDSWFKESQSRVHDYSSYILSIKDNQDHTSGQLLNLIHQALDVEVINEYTPLLEKSKTLLDWKLDELSLPSIKLSHLDKNRELEVGVSVTEDVIAITAQGNSIHGEPPPLKGTNAKQGNGDPIKPQPDQRTQQSPTSVMAPTQREATESGEDPQEQLSSLLAHLLQLKDILEVVRDQDSGHEDVSCDSCDKNIQGIRYKCCACSNYDLCDDCFGLPREIMHDIKHIFMKMNRPMADMKIDALLNRIKQDAISYGKNMDFKSTVHLSHLKCMKCKTAPIKGIRFRCMVCNGDMCSSCEAEAKNFHDVGHPVIVLNHPSRM